MKAIALSTCGQEWQPGSGQFGESSIYQGTQLSHLKVLSDRRDEGGGVAFLLRFSPPQGKLMKLVAVARSDEHIYVLEGGYCDKLGQQLCLRLLRTEDAVPRAASSGSRIGRVKAQGADTRTDKRWVSLTLHPSNAGCGQRPWLVLDWARRKSGIQDRMRIEKIAAAIFP